MEFQAGQKVVIKSETDVNFYGHLIFTVLKNRKFAIEVQAGNIKCLFPPEALIVYNQIDNERLEAAFYEYFDNIYSDPIEKHELVRKSVDELMNVVKSVSINE